MFRSLVAILAITVTTSVFADDLGDQIKARVKAKIAARLDLSGPRRINNINVVEGRGHAVNASADRSQNLTLQYREGDITYAPQTSVTYAPVTTTTDSRRWSDSRQWNLREGDTTSTYAPRYTEGDRTTTYAPRSSYPAYAPAVATYVPTRLTYSSVVVDRPTTIGIRCWSSDGSYFVDAEGRRFNLLPSYSAVAYGYRHMTLPGRYWRSSSGTLFYTAAWGTTVKTFQYAGL